MEDTVEAILAVIEKGKENEIYNVGSGEYSENIEIATTVKYFRPR